MSMATPAATVVYTFRKMYTLHIKSPTIVGVIQSIMSEATQSELFNQGPALLGSPELDSYRAYIVADKLPHLTPEEDEILGTAVYNGRLAAEQLADLEKPVGIQEQSSLEHRVEHGQVARRALASRYTTLVIGMSRNFAYNTDRRYDQERRAEMIAVGNVALMKCMDSYIPIPGRTFAPFAATAVKNAMIAEVMTAIRSNTGRSYKSQRVLLEVGTAHQAAQAEGVDISFEEMAVKLGHSPERIQSILKLSEVRWHSFDETPASMPDSGLTLANVIPDPNAEKGLYAVEDRMGLEQIWATAKDLRRRQILSAAEWQLLEARYNEGMTRQQVTDQLEIIKTHSGAAQMEQRILNKIRKEIELPGYHDKKCGVDLRIVESAVDLLEILEIPISEGTDIIGQASNILDNIRLTPWQREVMHALMGTNGHHFRPKELARLKDRSHRAIYDAREKATENVIRAWREMSDEQKVKTVTTKPDVPVSAASRGPRPNVAAKPADITPESRPTPIPTTIR